MNALKRVVITAILLLLVLLPARAQEACNSETIGYGQQRSAYLFSGCQDTWQFYGAAGDSVTVTMERETEAIDPYLRVGQAGIDFLTLATDDDSGGNLNARVSLTLPETGQYVILASSFNSDDEGEYTLTLQGPPPTEQVNCRDLSQALFSGEIGYDQQQQGYNAFCHGSIWAFYGGEGDVITISLDARFDTYLTLITENYEVLAQNDDRESDDLNSEIVYTLPYNGRYLIVASGYGANDTGSYTLTLNAQIAACTIIVNAAQLNMRAGPGTIYPVIASYPQGTEAEPVGYNAGWWYVRIRRQFGWLSMELTTASGGCNNLSIVPAPPTPTWTPTVTPSRTPTATNTVTRTPTPTGTPTDEAVLADLSVEILNITWPNGDHSQITIRLEVSNLGGTNVGRARVEVQPEFDGWDKKEQIVSTLRAGAAKQTEVTLDVPQAARGQIVDFVATVTGVNVRGESSYANNTDQLTFDLRLSGEALTMPDTGGVPNFPSWLPVAVGGTIGLIAITSTGEMVRRRRTGQRRKQAEKIAQEQLELPCKKGQIAYRKRKFAPEFSLLKITEISMEVSLPNSERVLWQRTLNGELAEALTAALVAYRATNNREHAAQMLAPTAIKLLHHVFSALAREDGLRDVVISGQAEGSSLKVEYTRCRCEGQGQHTHWRELEEWEHEAKDEREKKIVKLRNIDPRDTGMPARLSRDMVEWLLHFLRRI